MTQHFCCKFLGTFEKLRKATISFVMSVSPSVGMEHLGSHWTDFHENRYFCIFRKSVDKIQVSLKSDKNNGTLRGDLRIFMKISRAILLRKRNISERCRKNQTHILCSI